MFGSSSPFWRFDRTVAPVAAPVVLADVRMHSRIDDDDTGQDDLIEVWIDGAVEAAESYTGRSLMTQTWRATSDRFPVCGAEIELRHGPVQSVTSITYLAADGTTQTLDPATYVLETSGAVARVAPTYGSAWPATRPQLAAVKVLYVAGYGDDPEDVPKSIRQWLLVRVGTQYEHREEVETVRGKIDMPAFIDGLLDIHRVVPV